MGTDKELNLPKSPVTVANILAGPLAELGFIIASLTESGGLLALSGILTEQSQSVIDAYSKDFVMNKVKDSDGWALLTGTRKVVLIHRRNQKASILNAFNVISKFVNYFLNLSGIKYTDRHLDSTSNHRGS